MTTRHLYDVKDISRKLVVIIADEKDLRNICMRVRGKRDGTIVVSYAINSAYDQAVETSRLFDLYIVFYSAFLPVHLRGQYLPLVDQLMQ